MTLLALCLIESRYKYLAFSECCWLLVTSLLQVSTIGFIMVHGLNECYIAPYTNIEFQLTKYQTYIVMKS